jgi:DNA-binding NarL/FixJ family response regulator
MAIAVAFADDNLLVREGVAELLQDADGDIELIGVCEDMDTLLALVEDRRPDVVVTDIRMPPTHTDEGIRVAAELRRSRPEIGVVVLSNYPSAVYGLALLDSGSAGRAYLLKESLHDREQLVSAIHAVAAGGSVMDPRVIEPLVAARSQSRSSLVAELTPRERDVLSAIAQGKSNAAIGGALGLTKRAVEKHINSIFLKLNLSDAQDVSKRVKSALVFLAETAPGPR